MPEGALRVRIQRRGQAAGTEEPGLEGQFWPRVRDPEHKPKDARPEESATLVCCKFQGALAPPLVVDGHNGQRRNVASLPIIPPKGSPIPLHMARGSGREPTNGDKDTHCNSHKMGNFLQQVFSFSYPPNF